MSNRKTEIMRRLVVISTVAILGIGSTATASAQDNSGSSKPLPSNSDGTCPDGFGATPIGCCPLGTENVHNFCESRESHQQATDNYLKCLIERGAEDIITQHPQLHIADCPNQG
jgi:hypothetical protein